MFIIYNHGQKLPIFNKKPVHPFKAYNLLYTKHLLTISCFQNDRKQAICHTL